MTHRNAMHSICKEASQGLSSTAIISWRGAPKGRNSQSEFLARINKQRLSMTGKSVLKLPTLGFHFCDSLGYGICSYAGVATKTAKVLSH